MDSRDFRKYKIYRVIEIKFWKLIFQINDIYWLFLSDVIVYSPILF